VSPVLPIVSGAAVVVALAKVGYEQGSEGGSHVKLRRDGRTVIVPLHREFAPGTLRSLLRQASLTPPEFIPLL
jgi:predicted RNA binding protein YcfA (HicA-like mRNA interferase family)